MSIETVENVSLSEIPDLDSGVSSSREEVPSVRVEGDLVDRLVGGIVVLDESLASDVPDLDGVV